MFEVYMTFLGKKSLIATFVDDHDAMEYIQFKKEQNKMMNEAYGHLNQVEYIIVEK